MENERLGMLMLPSLRGVPSLNEGRHSVSDWILDLQHTIWLLCLDDKLHLAPINKTSPRVLDAGCGTGIWSIEFGIFTVSHISGFMLMSMTADENPEAQVRLVPSSHSQGNSGEANATGRLPEPTLAPSSPPCEYIRRVGRAFFVDRFFNP